MSIKRSSIVSTKRAFLNPRSAEKVDSLKDCVARRLQDDVISTEMREATIAKAWRKEAEWRLRLELGRGLILSLAEYRLYKDCISRADDRNEAVPTQ